MSSSTELTAREGCDFGCVVPGTLGAAGGMRALRMLGALSVVMVCVMSAAAEPPEKPADNARTVAQDAPKTPTLTRKTGEEVKESQPQETRHEETPKERYIRLVIAQVEKRWHSCLRLRSDAQSPGRLGVDFYINTEGKLDDIRVVDDKQSHQALTEVTLRAIMEAEIPPMPAEVIPSLPMNDPKRLKISYTALVAYAEPKKKSDTQRGTKAMVKEDKTAKGRYTKLVTGQVEKKWRTYLRLRPEGLTAGFIQLVFYVNKMGKVEDLRIVNEKDSNPVLTEITLRAIKDAEIPPMPADVMPLLPKNDPARLKIQYDALIY